MAAILALPYYRYGSKDYVRIRNKIRRNYMNIAQLKESWARYNSRPESKQRRDIWYHNNREVQLKLKRAYWVKHRSRMRMLAHQCYNENRDLIKAKTRKYYQSWKYYNKFCVVFHYSNGEMCCKFCGENIFELLTLDHINNDGMKQRGLLGSGTHIYTKLRKLGYPIGIQILCYNCNCVKTRVSPQRLSEIINELQHRKLYMDSIHKEVI